MQNFKKIVIKVGTNVLTREDGLLDITTISHLVDQLAKIKSQGIEVLLVSSGAVGAGLSLIKLSNGLNKVVQRQVLSSIGQIKLMNIYTDLFANYDLLCAQVLATKEDFRDRMHYINMKNCFQALLRDNLIPIVNENDVVSVSELMFTDNDELAGLIASMINADTLIILSNVDGVFDGHPDDTESSIVATIDPDDKKAINFISHKQSSMGRGGMHTKFRIASKAAKIGITTFIANGKKYGILTDILKGDYTATKFIASKKVSNVKKWIAFNEPDQKGRVIINQGAAEALLNKDYVTSLLPIGIIAIEGEFKKGDIVKIVDHGGEGIGLGVAQYASERAKKIIGQKGKKPLIHYDFLFVEKKPNLSER
jgi:glutamate 5-kinase